MLHVYWFHFCIKFIQNLGTLNVWVKNLPYAPHYQVFAIKAASDITTSIIMKIFDHNDFLAIILVSSIDLQNISPLKPIQS